MADVRGVEPMFAALVSRRPGRMGAVEASAHGHAMLLVHGDYGDSPDAVDAVDAKAVASARALVAGREALRPA